jgi:hypothetical protein
MKRGATKNGSARSQILSVFFFGQTRGVVVAEDKSLCLLCVVEKKQRRRPNNDTQKGLRRSKEETTPLGGAFFWFRGERVCVLDGWRGKGKGRGACAADQSAPRH